MPRGVPKIKEPVQERNPSIIVLKHTYSFFDEDGVHHAWPGNKEIRNPFSIMMLIDRKVPFTIIKD